MFFPPSPPIPIPDSPDFSFGVTVDDLVVEIIKNRAQIRGSTISKLISVLRADCGGIKTIEFKPGTPSSDGKYTPKIPSFLGLK